MGVRGSVHNSAQPCKSRHVGPAPVTDFRHVLAVLGNVALVLDQLIAQGLLDCAASRVGTRSITSPARWKRSRSFTTMSNGVVVVPSSL